MNSPYAVGVVNEWAVFNKATVTYLKGLIGSTKPRLLLNELLCKKRIHIEWSKFLQR